MYGADISRDHVKFLDFQVPNSYASASLKCQCVTLAVGFKLAFVEIGAYIDLHIDILSIEKKHEEDELGRKMPYIRTSATGRC